MAQLQHHNLAIHDGTETNEKDFYAINRNEKNPLHRKRGYFIKVGHAHAVLRIIIDDTMQG